MQLLLQDHFRYSGTGNDFSRSLFALEFLEKCAGRNRASEKQAQENNVWGNCTGKTYFFLENIEKAKGFRKTFTRIGNREIKIIETELDYVEAILSKEGIFCFSSRTISFADRLNYLLDRRSLCLKIGIKAPEESITLKLTEYGYLFSESLDEDGQFRREGDAIFIRDRGSVYIVSFFDGEIEDIKEIRDGIVTKVDTAILPDRTLAQKNLEEKIEIPKETDWKRFEEENISYIAIETDFFFFREEILRFLSNQKSYLILDSLPSENYIDLSIDRIQMEKPDEIGGMLAIPENTLICYTRHPENLEVFEKAPNAHIHFLQKHLSLESFSLSIPGKAGVTFVLADDILAPIFTKKRLSSSAIDRLDLLLKMASGDYVVHRDHGIARFKGIVTKELPSGKREYLELEYAGDEKLFVPLSEVYRVGKYLGDDKPKLHRLSSGEWKKSVEKAEQDATKVAEELLDIYARRRVAHRPAFSRMSEEEKIFREAFPYKHTKDQIQAIEDILSDLAKPEPMDRLLSGDVGFGKTEVAMNAAYRVVFEGKQVAIVSPLVALAYDHFESISKRMESFGVRIAVLTRLTKWAEERKILEWLQKGEIDIVIGTHRLLGNDVHIKNLGLLIVDEEHKFGVIDKERIAWIRSSLDILSLSATPIPRSLNLALSGIRSVSLLTTPPFGKKPIRTEIARWNPDLVQNAIAFELARGGQVLVLHNRVRSIELLRKEIAELSPKGSKIAVTHGRLHGEGFEDILLDFKHGKYDILVSTTVIENGVNFLNANTILIDNADEFGLASLHQLRGRVGRKDVQAYCGLLYRKDSLEDDAKKRLIAIASNAHLGAGFEIAMRDMEIRGAGEILGVSQSGKTKDTGISLYLKILEEKVWELQGKPNSRVFDVRIELDIPYGIPDSYFTSDIDKLHFFRSLESVQSEKELDEARESFLEDRDELTQGTENLFLLIRARLLLAPYRIQVVRKNGKHYLFEFGNDVTLEILKKFLSCDPKGEFIFIGNGKIRTETEGYKNDVDFLNKIVYFLQNTK